MCSLHCSLTHASPGQRIKHAYNFQVCYEQSRGNGTETHATLGFYIERPVETCCKVKKKIVKFNQTLQFFIHVFVHILKCYSYLKELLNHIVSKHISHQLIRCLQDLVKHHLALSWSSSLQLLLYKSKCNKNVRYALREQQENLSKHCFNETPQCSEARIKHYKTY